MASLLVQNPSGNRNKVAIDPIPFVMGRQADNNLVLRDNRASRVHARIVLDQNEYVIEDLNSRHGVFVNGQRIQERHTLADSDRIDFGFQDSYKLTFHTEQHLNRILDRLPSDVLQPPGPRGGLTKLRALVEVAHALQTSMTPTDVLGAVVDAALTLTGCERGFLLLRKGDDLETSVARNHAGRPLPASDLTVPMSVINRALRSRRELLSMDFNPLDEHRPSMSVADLELRSVVCVPLIRIRTGGSGETLAASVNDTVGLLYMDSRLNPADLSSGNREILQTLALEASTILENARLLQEEREKQRFEEELSIARDIQRGLLPSQLPTTGWFRVAGSSIASREVGGDYFDVRQVSPSAWAVAIADVSGKGVSSALLAALLQGAFLLATDAPGSIEEMMRRVNQFLNERTRGEKYASLFFGVLRQDGSFRYANAGHPRPMLVRPGCSPILLDSTGLPLGMLEMSQYGVNELQLSAGDKLVLYTDGLSEAEDMQGVFFDKNGLRDLICSNAALDSGELRAKLMEGFHAYTGGADLTDDVTVVVFEYCP
jgi:serine phosphatase RsbU (regulator of sigma subunit)